MTELFWIYYNHFLGQHCCSVVLSDRCSWLGGCQGKEVPDTLLMSLPIRVDPCWVGGSWLYWVVCYCLRGAAQFTQCSAPHIMNLSFIWTMGLCSTQCLVFLCLPWCYANEVSIEQNCPRWMTTLLWLGHQEGSGLWQEYVFASPSPVKADQLTFLHGLYPGPLLDCRAWGFVPSSPLPNSLPSDAFKVQQLL